jgi:hypothetical protein
MVRSAPRPASWLALLASLPSCFETGLRWEDLQGGGGTVPPCTTGEQRCTSGEELQRCEEGARGAAWVTTKTCADDGLVCAAEFLKCTPCHPNQGSCDGQVAKVCRPDGSREDEIETCDPTKGVACRAGLCSDLCLIASQRRSNVGCEYWAVDLDNAWINSTSNAAGQQFAVVVSNAQHDVPTSVRVFQDDGAPGDLPAEYEIASAVIAPLNLQVFKLGPREIDGSSGRAFNDGTHTALTRHAYKIVTDFPVVAYQFNPLENVNVFSNDATLLKPREALTFGNELGNVQPAYVVAGWPQTIAITDNPDTNFSAAYPINLRSFLTIVGTRDGTTVRVDTNSPVGAGGPVPETPAGGTIEVQLGAFDVLNLETPDFNSFGADFTGSVVHADAPVAVFSGSEAADAPHYEKLSSRRCCADHLEDQLDPLRAMGRRFAIAHTPSRTEALALAGAGNVPNPEPDFVRFVAASSDGAVIRTTLPAPDDVIYLGYLGDFAEVTAYGDFMAESDQPISVAQVMASQDACGVPRTLPGGDPSLLIEPPIEQFRADYVFLTPDKYAFDFLSIVAPPHASIVLDGQVLDSARCLVTPTDGLTDKERGAAPPFITYTCQLSFPVVDPSQPAPDNVFPGNQNDGVHRLVASEPIGVVVSGFDYYVSYAYAAGTELDDLSVPK